MNAKLLKKIKLLLPIVLSLILVLVIYLVLTKNGETETKEQVPEMNITVKNEATRWLNCCSEDNAQYQVSFIKINSLSFRKQDGDLYIKYQLDGKLPKSSKGLPSFDGDKIKGVIYYMTLDDNYFDGNGKKNIGGPEASLKASFYGKMDGFEDSSKITIEGKLVDGGPGYDYFIEKFSMGELLVNENSSRIVFTASSLAVSKKLSVGASRFEVENSALAATKENNREIMINLDQHTVLPVLN